MCPFKRENVKCYNAETREKTVSTGSVASVFTIVPAIPREGPKESPEISTMPGRGLDIVQLTSENYWPVAPVATGVDRAGGGLIPPFSDASEAGDGVIIIEPGVMTVRPLPFGIAFTGGV